MRERQTLKAAEAKLITRSARDEQTGCLRWQGAHAPKGYGQICVDGRRMAVHRAAYQLWVGPIPDGYEIDHVAERGCAHRDCIEPTHLEAVTHAENVRRQLARVTHCPKGHEYSDKNTLWHTNAKGYRLRKCRECKRRWSSRPVECECGRTYTRQHRAEHVASAAHREGVAGQVPRG